MNKVTSILLHISLSCLLTSCTSSKLTEFTENCICEVTEHFIASTDEEEDRTKEFTFTDSPVFDFGVPKEGFANSMAILFNQKWNLDSMYFIKINLVNDPDGKNKMSSIEFDQRDISQQTVDYQRTLDLINSFVRNIYQGKYEDCLNMVDIDMALDQFSTIMSQVRSGLEDDYINTRIVSYVKKNGETSIYGGVWTKNETLDLFRMTLRESNDELKIASFEF